MRSVDDVQPNFARDLWTRIETINAVVYFDDAPTDAGKVLGADGFWMNYFGMRAAPMGAVSGAVVEATFFNFSPLFVRRWVPALWRIAPAAWLAARRDSVSVALRRHGERELDLALQAVPALLASSEVAVTAGRPLFAANRSVDPGDDPVAALWQACTNLREHRGDGHVAALTAAGVDGIESHVLIALANGTQPELLQRSRGWSDEDWAAAVDRLRGRGVVAVDGTLSTDGARLRGEIEATTDRLAATAFVRLDGAGRRQLLDQLSPLAATIAGSGVLRYPNPMSLPAFSARQTSVVDS